MSNDFIDKADEELAEIEDEPMDLSEFLSLVQKEPSVASQSAKYLLEAIEYYGTREVTERGEELERYCFFDDPAGNGEHAVLGNTKTLNQFVDQLRRYASEEGDNDGVFWFTGPTATGKSELKRCLINGLRAYSRTEEGRRYTVEWSIQGASNGRAGLSYGEETTSTDWYKSPVNTTPLSVLPEATREEFLDDVNEDLDQPISANEKDPFSREAFNKLKREYSGAGNIFSKITSSDHLRVVRNLMDVGEGIGILHAEDGGSEKERLVGSWMPEMMKEFQSRGRKNPQAFAYDGVLSQGNSGLSVIEDARLHIDVIQRLMNIPEEGTVKIDKKISMDIDTVLMLISNPDLEAEITQYDEEGQHDPMRALRRRLNKYDLNYLTSVSLETELLYRMLTNDHDLWQIHGEEALEKIREPAEVYGCSFEPHSIAAAAMYDVISRMSNSAETEEFADPITPVEKAKGVEIGYIERAGVRKSAEELELVSPGDGESGIPATFTSDVLTDLAQSEESVLGWDVIDEICDSFAESAVLGTVEGSHYESVAENIERYVLQKYEEDLLEAMVGDIQASEEEIREYIDALFAWEEADNDEPEDDEFDPYRLMEFEIEYLGSDEDGYTKAIPRQDVKKFRKERVIQPVNTFIYNSRGSSFSVGDIDLTEVPVFSSLLGDNQWDDVFRHYENVDFDQWRSPPKGTETKELKEKAINRMVDEMGYSEEGAEEASLRVVNNGV